MRRKYHIWLTIEISCLLVLSPFVGYGASLTIGNTVSVNGNMSATSFSGDGSGLTNVGGSSSCTPITSLPKIITASGVYCLTSDLLMTMDTGNAVEIQADNVVIDLNGYKLDGQAVGPTMEANGIYAYQRKNITIRNGTVRGFFAGIWLNDVTPYTTSQGHLIGDIRADMNTAMGIFVAGKGNIIRNNQVVSTGGSSTATRFLGIVAYGPGGRILNNDVVDTDSGYNGGTGIFVVSAFGTVVENNRVGNSSLSINVSYGIYLAANNVLVSNNRVTTMNYGIYYEGGTATGLYMNNLVAGCSTPFQGGTAAGSTNYSIP